MRLCRQEVSHILRQHMKIFLRVLVCFFMFFSLFFTLKPFCCASAGTSLDGKRTLKQCFQMGYRHYRTVIDNKRRKTGSPLPKTNNSSRGAQCLPKEIQLPQQNPRLGHRTQGSMPSNLIFVWDLKHSLQQFSVTLQNCRGRWKADSPRLSHTNPRAYKHQDLI